MSRPTPLPVICLAVGLGVVLAWASSGSHVEMTAQTSEVAPIEPLPAASVTKAQESSIKLRIGDTLPVRSITKIEDLDIVVMGERRSVRVLCTGTGWRHPRDVYAYFEGRYYAVSPSARWPGSVISIEEGQFPVSLDTPETLRYEADIVGVCERS